MEEVENILRRNGIEPLRIEKSEVSPEESRQNYVISTGSETYHLSFPLERDVPVDQRPVKEKIYAEEYAFSRINDTADLRAPEVVDSSKEYILTKEIDGIPTIEKFRDSYEKGRREVAEKLGAALLRIHSVSCSDIGHFGTSDVEEKYSSWREFFEPLVADIRENSRTRLEKRSSKYLKDNIDTIDIEISPVLVYGDFQPWNTISKEGEALGVIDGESAFGGHREYDLAQTAVAWSDKFDVTETSLESYREKAELEEGWQERHDYYKVYLFTSAIMNAREVGWNELVTKFEERLDLLLDDLV